LASKQELAMEVLLCIVDEISDMTISGVMTSDGAIVRGCGNFRPT
jgi:hypothetical protein